MARSAKRQRAEEGKKKKSGVAPAHNHSEVLTKDGQINISQSKVKVWTQCRRMYHYKFVMLIQRKKIKRPFMFGRIVHEIIEAEIEGKDWEKVLSKIELDNKKLFRREIEMYGNIIDDIRDIMTDYFRFWDGTFKPMKHDGRRSEFEFRIELDDGLWFTGRIDTVGKAKGMRWLVEHKTFNRMPSEDDRWRSVQGAVYFRALEEMGFPQIDGVMWDYVNSKPLNVPGERTKTGRISQARIDSTPARIKRWLKEEGLKKKDHRKLLDDAEANLRNRFIRVYSPVKRRVVDNLWDNFVDTAKEIQQLHGTQSGQNIGRHCTWCDYQPLCKAEATGADVDWIIEREYQKEDTSHKRDEGRDED